MEKKASYYNGFTLPFPAVGEQECSNLASGCLVKTLIPARKSNFTHYKVWGEITYPFPNFNGSAGEVWEWIRNFTPHFSSTWLLIYVGIKSKSYWGTPANQKEANEEKPCYLTGILTSGAHNNSGIQTRCYSMDLYWPKPQCACITNGLLT